MDVRLTIAEVLENYAETWIDDQTFGTEPGSRSGLVELLDDQKPHEQNEPRLGSD